MRSGDPLHHHSALFPVRYHGSFPGGAAGNGPLSRAYDPVCHWDGRDKDCMDLWSLSAAQIPAFPVYLLPGILDLHYRHAGSVLLVCAETVYPAAEGAGRLHSLGQPASTAVRDAQCPGE